MELRGTPIHGAHAGAPESPVKALSRAEKVLAQGCQEQRAIRQPTACQTRPWGLKLEQNRPSTECSHYYHGGGGEPVSKPLMLGNTYERRRQRVEMLKTWFHPGGMVPTLALGGQATLELTPEIRRTLTEDLLSARLP